LILLTCKWAVGGARGGVRELQNGRSAVNKVQNRLSTFQLFKLFEALFLINPCRLNDQLVGRFF
jgi:hypothetical protein